MSYKNQIASVLAPIVNLEASEIVRLMETPKDSKMGDIAFPCFQLAKTLRKAPPVIAAELKEQLEPALQAANAPVAKIEVVGAYINFFLDQAAVMRDVIATILSTGEQFGASDLGQGAHVTIDLSSPNIAKPFSMGHLRSTVIGNALANILDKLGYKSVRINHLGDWGTQFGKLIVAYKKWGTEEEVRQAPIPALLRLYVKFHEEAANDSTLEEQGREWFKKLEDGDSEAQALWQWFRDESLKEFNKTYELMGIKFDSLHGEAFYNDKMDRVVDMLEAKGLLVEDEGALVVKLEEFDMPPSLIKKSDGATLYATRDLAAALYRHENYNFAKALYVVGGEQRLHFKQVFKVLEKMGFEWAQEMHHIPFGMMLKDGKKMSTRKGKVVLLDEVLQQAIDDVRNVIKEKNPNLANADEVAKAVGVGAVIFHDLKNFRLNDINFSLEDMLTFEGETGPYVQYTHARACSILRKADYSAKNSGTVELAAGALEGAESWAVVTMLLNFPNIIQRAGADFDPSVLGKYVIDLAQAFNKFYAHVRVLDEDEAITLSRLHLVAATVQVLRTSLHLLGLQAPQEM
ncbi:arginine--tRNA ligase [Tumebacillus permanentifrigoris]|uniref:Arginine--tRNA ligase n=1 Tax=Tumebacillus permanentifrigoris TaxID=378543 RepID=A0A316D8V6_9BACL|nr:arginine--tRNA ligase [Tumebacillus permanentifrigoris]PWK13422.1 arginyl-tRNA synthetase [Tumebacillus permanentifrigoris]